MYPFKSNIAGLFQKNLSKIYIEYTAEILDVNFDEF
jgi:hypothetical protein